MDSGLPYWLSHPTVLSPSSATATATDTRAALPDGLCEALGIESLFPFQAFLIDRLRHSDSGDLAVSAPTGSGKTLAYVLPMVMALRERRVKSVLRAVVVVPVKDLVGQVEETVRVVEEALSANSSDSGSGSDSDDHSASASDSDSDSDNSSASDSDSHNPITNITNKDKSLLGSTIVVCTPGRLVDLLQKKGLNLAALEWLIVDEADRLLDHSTQSVWLPDLLARQQQQQQAMLCGADVGEAWRIRCRKLLFSATLTTNPAKLAPLQLTRPELVLVRPDADAEADAEDGLCTPAGLREGLLVIAGRDALSWKLGALVELLRAVREGGKVLIFCRSTEAAISLCQFLQRVHGLSQQGVSHGLPQSEGVSRSQQGLLQPATTTPLTTTAVFHAHLNPQQRSDLLTRFKSCPSLRFLVSTDALARGIHLPSVDLVVNYDPPSFSSTYVHRVGRTARGGGGGVAVSLVPGNAVLHMRRILEGQLGKCIKRFNVHDGVVEPVQTVQKGNSSSVSDQKSNASSVTNSSHKCIATFLNALLEQEQNVVGKMEIGERELSHLGGLIDASLK